MSLSAQIAVGPSRALAAMEAVVLTGALVISTATLAIRWAPYHLMPAVAASMVVAVVLTWLRVHHRLRSPPRRFSLGPGRATMWAEGDRLRYGTIGDGTLAWPGFVVLSLESEGPRAARMSLPVLRLESGGDTARHLQRLVVWLSRSGHAARASTGIGR